MRPGTSRRRAIAAFLAVACLPAVGRPAGADTGSWPDRRDGRGPLAIEKIDIGHVPYDDTTVEITFEKAVHASRLTKKDFFLVDFDEDGDRKSEQWVYFVPHRRGRWRSFTYYPRSKGVSYGTHRFKWTSPRSVTITAWGTYAHYVNGGYLFRVVSYSEAGGCARGCWDLVPDSSWLIHDWTPPRLVRFDVPEFSLAGSDRPLVPVRWRVTDRGFSGVREQTLWKRLAGSEEWMPAARSRSSRPVSRFVEAEQGQTIDLRMTAADGAGNRLQRLGGEPTRVQTVVPFDDTSSSNAATYVGAWEVQERSDAFLAGVHVSTTPLDTFRFLGEAERYCVSYLPGEEFGSARFEVGGERITFDLGSGNPYGGRTYCLEPEERASHSAVLSVESGVINVDAFWLE